MDENNELLTIHDCFGVSMDKIEFLNVAVRKVLINLFKDRKNIDKLLLQLEKNMKRGITKKRYDKLKKIGKGINIDEIMESYYLVFPG